MTLDKIVYSIREALKEYTDDSELDDRYITYLVNLKRSKYLRQELEKFGRKFNNSILQTLCLPVEEVSANECNLNLGCEKVIRTSKVLPELLQLETRDSISRISPSDKLSKKFNFISREKATHYLDSLYSDKIKAFLHDDDRIYFVSSDQIFLECVSVTGIFEDPTELKNYKDCCNCNTSENCFDIYTSEYPLSPHLLDIIRQDIIKELAQLKGIEEDKINNSQNDI